MALVPYSDSDSDFEDHRETPIPNRQSAPSPPPTLSNANTLKRKRVEAEEPSSDLPPLPALFHDLYSTNARASTRDDPSLHQGRKRAVPHTEGMWPSHLYLEWYPSFSEAEHLQTLIDAVQNAFARLWRETGKPHACCPDVVPALRSELGAPLPLHISLSRTLQIPTDERDPFQETVTRCLRKAAVDPFRITCSGLKWVPNFDRNRWFLVLGIMKPERDELNRLLDACNDAAERMGYPCLYKQTGAPSQKKPPSEPGKPKRSRADGSSAPEQPAPERVDRTEAFHISIASTLQEPAPEYNTLLAKWELNPDLKTPKDKFQVVKVKIGNVIHNFELGGKKILQEEGFSILG